MNDKPKLKREKKAAKALMRAVKSGKWRKVGKLSSRAVNIGAISQGTGAELSTFAALEKRRHERHCKRPAVGKAPYLLVSEAPLTYQISQRLPNGEKTPCVLGRFNRREINVYAYKRITAMGSALMQAQTLCGARLSKSERYCSRKAVGLSGRCSTHAVK